MDKMKPVKAVLFDLDGTLLDTLQDLANAVNYALAAHCLPTRRLEEVRAFVGNGMAKLMERAVPDGTSNPKYETALTSMKAYYKEHCFDYTKPYDKIPDMLQKFKDKRILTAVVSNKLDSAVKPLCSQYFNGCIDIAVGDSPQTRRKPAPDMIIQTLRAWNLSPQEALYVGDSEVDILTAIHANIECISVTWGFKDRDFLIAQGAKILVDTVEELERLLLSRCE